jgi:hypothetical protein
VAFKRSVGKPLKFSSPKVLQKKIDAYFRECEAHTRKAVTQFGQEIDAPDPIPFTVSGLAYALDTNRQVLLDYGAREKYADTISRAKARIMAFGEQSLWRPGIARGVMFSLSNNFGMSERHEVAGIVTHKSDASQLSEAEIESKIISVVGAAIAKQHQGGGEEDAHDDTVGAQPGVPERVRNAKHPRRKARTTRAAVRKGKTKKR